MSRLIRGNLNDGGHIAHDHWVTISDRDQIETLAADALPLVPLALFTEWQVSLGSPGRQLGVLLEPADAPEALAPHLARLSLVAIRFPSFTDGRGYSIARLLRERLGYTGELRAVGDILRDQVFYLLRCGFDSLALRDDQDVAACLLAFGDFREAYQSAVDRPVPLFRRRTAALAALTEAMEE